jgi:hypothetical protein
LAGFQQGLEAGDDTRPAAAPSHGEMGRMIGQRDPLVPEVCCAVTSSPQDR